MCSSTSTLSECILVPDELPAAGLPSKQTGRRQLVRAVLNDHLDTHTGAEPDALLFAPSRGGCH